VYRLNQTKSDQRSRHGKGSTAGDPAGCARGTYTRTDECATNSNGTGECGRKLGRHRAPSQIGKAPLGYFTSGLDSVLFALSLNIYRFDFFISALIIYFILKLKLWKIKYILKLYYVINHSIVKIDNNCKFCLY
jgi:hypothetical protein